MVMTSTVKLSFVKNSFFMVKFYILHKREFSDTNYESGKPCQHFDWMLQTWSANWEATTSTISRPKTHFHGQKLLQTFRVITDFSWSKFLGHFGSITTQNFMVRLHSLPTECFIVNIHSMTTDFQSPFHSKKHDVMLKWCHLSKRQEKMVLYVSFFEHTEWIA